MSIEKDELLEILAIRDEQFRTSLLADVRTELEKEQKRVDHVEAAKALLTKIPGWFWTTVAYTCFIAGGASLCTAVAMLQGFATLPLLGFVSLGTGAAGLLAFVIIEPLRVKTAQ